MHMLGEVVDFALLRIIIPITLFIAAFSRYNGLSFLYLCCFLVSPLLKRCKTAVEEFSIRSFLIALLCCSGLCSLAHIVFIVVAVFFPDNLSMLPIPANNCTQFWSSLASALHQVGLQRVGQMPFHRALRLIFPDPFVLCVSFGVLLWHVYRARQAAHEPLLLEPVTHSRGHSRQPSDHTTIQAYERKVWHAWAREYCGGLLIVVLTGVAGITSPSLMSMVYLVVYLGICTYWACRFRHITMHVSYARLALLLYSALHVMLYYLYQFPVAQKLLTNDSKASGLLGLYYIVQSNCSSPGEMIFTQRRWIDYAAPFVTLALCFVTGVETRRWCDTVNINNPFMVIRYISNRMRRHRRSTMSSQRMVNLKSLTEFRNVNNRHHSLASQRSAQPMTKGHRRMASDDHHARLLEVNYLPGMVEEQELSYTGLNSSPIGMELEPLNEWQDRTHAERNAVTSSSNSGGNTPPTPPLRQSLQPTELVALEGEDQQTEEQERTNVRDRPLLLSLLHTVLRNSYILSLIAMMSWSVAYRSWLTFVLLVSACVLWIWPNCRRACLVCSPFLVVYGIVLLLIQYVSSLHHAELPSQNPEYGMQRMEIPMGALAVQMGFLVVFWLTLRLFLLERANVSGHMLMTAFEFELEALTLITSPESTSTVNISTTKFTEQDNRLYLKMLRIIKAFSIRFWIVLCCLAMLFESIMQPVVIFRIVYMIFLLYFLLTFMVNYAFWRKQMLTFWWVVIVYSMVVLVCIYTYQFGAIPLYWHNNTNLSNSTLSDIGLERFHSGTLLHRLLSPVVFIVIIILQVHYCHRPFLRISNLDRYDSESTRRRYSNRNHGLRRQTTAASSEDELEEDLNQEGEDAQSSSSDSTEVTTASDFIEDVNSALHTVSKKIYRFVRSSYFTLWRFMEVHWSKVFVILVMIHCIRQVSIMNLVLVVLLTTCLPFYSTKRMLHVLILFWAGFMLVAKMIYQLKIVRINWRQHCNVRNDTNVSDFGNMEQWLGLRKSPTFVYDNLTLILIIVAAAIQHTIMVHQKQFYNYSRNQRTEPLQGIIFSDVTNKTVDHTILTSVKYLLNFAFYKTGLELCFCMTVVTACLRVDVYSVLYLLLMAVFLFSSRRFSSKLWLPYCLVLGALIPLQYCFCVGLPPFLCTDYPWSTPTYKMRTVLQQWLFLPHWSLPPVSKRLMADFFQYLFVCWQYHAFCLEKELGSEYGGGSNEPVLNNTLPEAKGNKTKDFISSKDSYMDYVKHFVFYWFYWISLVIIFITGVTWITLFCLGYIIISFIYFWMGQNIFLRKRRHLIHSWNFVILYTFCVVIAKVTLQLLGCLYGEILNMPEKWGWLVNLFGVQCLNPLSLNVFASPDAKYELFSGLHWDVISFVVIILQRKLFMSRSFSFVVIDLNVQSKFASRGAFLINRTLVSRFKQQQEKEDKSVEKVRSKVEKIRQRQEAIGRNNPDVKEHYLVLRSGDYYLFDGDPEEEDLTAGVEGSKLQREPGGDGTLESNVSHTYHESEKVAMDGDVSQWVNDEAQQFFQDVHPEDGDHPESSGVRNRRESGSKTVVSTCNSPQPTRAVGQRLSFHEPGDLQGISQRPSLQRLSSGGFSADGNIGTGSYSLKPLPASAGGSTMTLSTRKDTLPPPASPSQSVRDASLSKSVRGGTTAVSTLSTHAENGEDGEEDSDDELQLSGGAPSAAMLNPIKIFNQAVQEGPRKTLHDYRKKMNTSNPIPTSVSALATTSQMNVSSSSAQIPGTGTGIGSGIEGALSGTTPIHVSTSTLHAAGRRASAQLSPHRLQVTIENDEDDVSTLGSKTRLGESSPHPISILNHTWNASTFTGVSDAMLANGHNKTEECGLTPPLDTAAISSRANISSLGDAATLPRWTDKMDENVDDDMLISQSRENAHLPLTNSLITNHSLTAPVDLAHTSNDGCWSKFKASTMIIVLFLRKATQACTFWLNIQTKVYRGIRRKIDNEKRTVKKRLIEEIRKSDANELQLDYIVEGILREGDLVDNPMTTTIVPNDVSPSATLATETAQQRVSGGDRDELQREKEFKRSRNIFFVLMIAVGNMAIGYSEMVCYCLLLFNHLYSASVLSLPYPLMVFLWGMLSVPRPSKTFWITLITYTEVVIVIKYIFQFNLFTFNKRSLTTTEEPLWLPGIFGIEKAEYYAVLDLVQLLFIFLHRGYLKNNGLWRDDSQSRNDLEQAQKQLNTGNQTTAVQPGAETGTGTDTDPAVAVTENAPQKQTVSRTHNTWFKKLQHFYLKMTDPTLNKKVDVYVLMFIMEFLAFLIIIFGYKSFGPSTAIGDSAFEFIRRNRIPVPFICMLVVQFLLILLDRALFLRKNVLGKFIFQIIHVIMIHAWLFFLLPWLTKASFMDTLPPRILYVIKCVYFGLSAYQIRSGYPKSIMGNFLTQNYNYMNLVLFKIYLMIPFLYEMRNIMDWIWTDTTLALYHWMEVEDVYAKVFVLKCWRRAEQEYPTKRSTLRYAYIKYTVGLLLLGLCFLCIWTPLVVSSFIGTTFVVNPPVQCTFEVALGSFPPIYTVTARQLDRNDLNNTDMDLLKRCHENDQRALGHLNYFETRDVTDIRPSGHSSTMWSITPPHLVELQRQLRDFTEPMHVHFEMTCRRTVKEVGSSEQVVVFQRHRQLLREERQSFSRVLQLASSSEVSPLNLSRAMDMNTHNAADHTDVPEFSHAESVGGPVALFYLTPRYIIARRDRMEELTAVSQSWNYVNVSASLWVSQDTKTGEIWRWWSLRELSRGQVPDYDELCPWFGTRPSTVSREFSRSVAVAAVLLGEGHGEEEMGLPGGEALFNLTEMIRLNNVTLERGPRILSFNERVYDNIFGKVFSSYGIIGLYAAYIFVVHRILRVLYSDITYIIQYQEMPNVDRILKLCHEIYLVRERRFLDLEEELVARLIFLFRSNDSLIKYTRHRKSMLLDFSQPVFPPYKKVSAKHFRD